MDRCNQREFGEWLGERHLAAILARRGDPSRLGGMGGQRELRRINRHRHPDGRIGTPTVTALTSSQNPSMVGASITLTAAVSSSVAGATIPTGTVVFQDGTTILGSGTLGLTGTATFATSALTAGTHSIQATYAGDSFFAGSVSPVVSQVVRAPRSPRP